MKRCIACNHNVHIPGKCSFCPPRGQETLCPCKGPGAGFMTPEAARAHLGRKARGRSNNAKGAAWQRRIVDLAQAHGWLAHHQRPGMFKDGRYASQIMGNKGFLDTLLCCPREVSNRGCFIVEAKTGDARLTADETAWFRSLVRAGVECYVLKPEDEPFLVRRLQGKVESEKP